MKTIEEILAEIDRNILIRDEISRTDFVQACIRQALEKL